MTINERKKQICNKVFILTGETCKQEDFKSSLLKIQKDMAYMVFDKEHVDSSVTPIKFSDICDHLLLRDIKTGKTQYNKILQFKIKCEKLGKIIACLINGEKGENIVYKNLLGINGKILQNIVLKNDNGETEIDDIVITSNGIFCIEVKNVNHSVYVDESGCYDPIDKKIMIGDKINYREGLLYNLIKNNNIPIEKINIKSFLVFVNGKQKYDVYNENITSCYSVDLPYKIRDYHNDNELSTEDIDAIVKIINDNKIDSLIKLPMDFVDFRNEFADILANVEFEGERIKKGFINHILHGYNGLRAKIQEYPITSVLTSSVFAGVLVVVCAKLGLKSEIIKKGAI